MLSLAAEGSSPCRDRWDLARLDHFFVDVSLKMARPPAPLSAAPSWNTIRWNLNSSKNFWTASRPPSATIGSGVYVRSSTTTTKPRGVAKFRSNLTTAALVKVLVCSGNAPAMLVMSGFMNQIEFQDWKPTTRSAFACCSATMGDTGALAHPATPRQRTSRTLGRNML